MRQNVVWSLIENLYSIIRRNACVIVRTWSCAVSVRDIVSKKWDGAIQLNAEAHRMILSTRDLDFEKIHKGIFTHDKAKNKWIKKRLENPTLDYPGIYSSTLYSSGGLQYSMLLATCTSTLSIMVLEESVHAVKPNTTQILLDREKATQPYHM